VNYLKTKNCKRKGPLASQTGQVGHIWSEVFEGKKSQQEKESWRVRRDQLETKRATSLMAKKPQKGRTTGGKKRAGNKRGEIFGGKEQQTRRNWFCIFLFCLSL
jgi:hypothetical protein